MNRYETYLRENPAKAPPSRVGQVVLVRDVRIGEKFVTVGRFHRSRDVWEARHFGTSDSSLDSVLWSYCPEYPKSTAPDGLYFMTLNQEVEIVA